jgi:calcineurin-like phosphoesterase family protein
VTKPNAVNSLWLISDTHFGHKNIVRFQARPESHEVIMLDNWIRRVPDGAVLLHLGDVFLGKQGNPERWARVISRMPGDKFLILGNHDKAKRRIYEEVAGFEIVPPFIQNGVAFSHRPITPEYPMYDEGTKRDVLDDVAAGWHTNVHGHTHSNAYRPDGTFLEDKRYINVSVEVTDLAPVQLGNVLNRTVA